MKTLNNIFHCDPATIITLPPYKPEGFKITIFPNKEHEVNVAEYDGAAPPLPFAASDVHTVRATRARTLCASADGFKPVYELSLDVENTPIANNFNPGDTIGVLPKNNEDDVNFLLKRLELSSQCDFPCSIENVDTKGKSQIPKHVPVKSTLGHIFTNCVELRSVVKKLFIRSLVDYCHSENERKCLELMCSKEGSELYTEHVLSKNISLIEILKAFPSCKPSVPCLLTHLPRLLPRPYSIVNSKLTDKNIVKICFSVAEIRPGRKGLTTERLQRIAVNVCARKNGDFIETFKNLDIKDYAEEKIPIYLRKNLGFQFPSENEKVILVSPGTGVAPFVGFLEERAEIAAGDAKVELGETWLFFGCKDGKVDHIYEEELGRFLDKKVLTRISTTFSRVDKDGIKYVQDAIRFHAREVSEFIMGGARVFVCGDLSVMAKQVEEAFVACLETADMTRQEAVQFVKRMQKERKYLTDVWS